MSDDPVSRRIKEQLASIPDEVKIVYAAMDPLPKSEEDLNKPARIWIGLHFSEKGFGYGEIDIIVDQRGRVVVDTETMGKKRVIKYLTMLLEQAIDDIDEDPERHALYNEIRGRRCSNVCKACYPDPGIQ